MAFIGAKPTNVPLTSSDLQDNIITSAKIVDGTIATADISDGAVTSVKTTGVGGVNTPAFFAYLSTSGVSSADSATTKIPFNTEDYDSDNCYDNSTNYRFTPTTAGKYFVFASLRFDSSADWDGFEFYMKKNGTNIADIVGRNEYFFMGNLNVIVDMNGTTDYLECYGRQTSGSTLDFSADTSGTRRLCKFGAYRIIE
jgi:hypothetical protein